MGRSSLSLPLRRKSRSYSFVCQRKIPFSLSPIPSKKLSPRIYNYIAYCTRKEKKAATVIKNGEIPHPHLSPCTFDIQIGKS
jgi:hypothetical protein